MMIMVISNGIHCYMSINIRLLFMIVINERQHIQIRIYLCASLSK